MNAVPVHTIVTEMLTATIQMVRFCVIAKLDTPDMGSLAMVRRNIKQIVLPRGFLLVSMQCSISFDPGIYFCPLSD